MTLRKKIINKEGWFFAFLNRLYYSIVEFGLPVPRPIARWVGRGARFLSGAFWVTAKIVWIEPIFRAQCRSVGRRLKMSRHSPYILGEGNIDIGDNCRINGKVNLYFSNRYRERPTLKIGSNCSIGHLSNINVAERVEIGDNVRIGSYVVIADADGHPMDKTARRDSPFDEESIRPVFIEKDAWIGRNSILLKGVCVGEGSIVGAGSVLTGDVPPDSLFAGNPARFIRSLKPENDG